MPGALLAGGAAVALFASVFSAQNTSTTTEVPTEKITVGLESINGSGCPRGTAAVAVAPDNTAFTVTYSDYLAQTGAGSSPTDFRKNCQLNVSVHIPQGFTYAIAAVDYRGYAHLASGTSGLQKAQYYFQGSPQTASQSHDFKGPYSGNWHTRDETEVAELVWAPCGEDKNININSELRVSGGASADEKATSFLAMDSTDGSVNTIYQLAWKKC